MSMNRAIHGAVRRDLDRFVGAVGSYRPGDQQRAAQLATAWAYFDDQLARHHHGEHEIAWPALRACGVSDELISSLDTEHEAMADALRDAGTAIGSLGAGGAESRDRTVSAFEQLRSVTVAHLDHEEDAVEPVYLAHEDSPEIKAMVRNFRREGAAQGGRLFAWVLDGATPEQRRAVSKGVPAPVLAVLGGVFGRDYRRNIIRVWRP